MIVRDNTKQAERLGSFFKNFGRISAEAGKKTATNVLKNPGRAWEITWNIANAAANKSPKAALSSLPEVINFYHTGKGLYQVNLSNLCHKMEAKTDRLYPSAPLKKIDLEQRLEKKLNDVMSFNNSVNNIIEMITYFKDENNKSKKKYKKYKTLTKILK